VNTWSKEWEDSPRNTKTATGQILSYFANVLVVVMIGQKWNRDGGDVHFRTSEINKLNISFLVLNFFRDFGHSLTNE